MIYLGADHGGFEIKEKVKEWLKEWSLAFEDLGNTVFDKDDDYPDFAARVGEKISQEKESLGILICRSGQGMDIVANKYPDVRSAFCFSASHAQQSRQHLNANILCLANDYLSEEQIKDVIYAFLITDFSFEERHKRRLEKIKKIEEENFK